MSGSPSAFQISDNCTRGGPDGIHGELRLVRDSKPTLTLRDTTTGMEENIAFGVRTGSMGRVVATVGTALDVEASSGKPKPLLSP